MAEAALKDPTLGPVQADVHLDYAPQGDVLTKFHRGTDFVRVIIGPLGSGKTQANMAEMFRRIHNQKKRTTGRTPEGGLKIERISRWAVVRNTYADLQSTTIKDFKEMFAPMIERKACVYKDGVGGSSPTATFKYRRSDGTVVRSEVLFLAYDRAEDQRKARGLQVTGLWLNEVKELNQTVVNQLCGRVGRFPSRAQLGDYWQGVIADCNAPDTDHWLGKLALGTAQADTTYGEWGFFIQPGAVFRRGNTWQLNPLAENLHNLPRGYYERQIAGAINENWIRCNLGNEFILAVDGRPVHPGFNQLLHTADDLQPRFGYRLTVGIDFGRTPAAAIMQRQVNGQWYILDELCTTNTGAKKFGKALRRFLNEKYANFEIEFWGDPAGDDMSQTDDDTPMEMLALSDIDCLPAPTNDFEIRTESLETLLGELIDGQPAVLIAKRCTTIIKGLAGMYQFARIATSQGDRYHDKPKKDPTSHVVEAVHYGLLGAGEGERLFESADTEQSETESDEDFGGWHPDWTGL